MPNYYYTDVNGNKRGPLNGEQLQALATKGVITPHTLLDADGGHQGVAGQIPGLKFPTQIAEDERISNVLPSSADDTLQPNTYSVAQVRYSSDTEATSILELLFDNSFRELRPETVVLWITKIVYVTGAIALILGALIICGTSIYTAFAFISESLPKDAAEWEVKSINAAKRAAFFAMLGTVPCVIIGCVVGVCLLRLACEWSIILAHYSIIWTIELIKQSIAIMKEIPKLLKVLRIYLETKLK
jgi:hypothetical protein